MSDNEAWKALAIGEAILRGAAIGIAREAIEQGVDLAIFIEALNEKWPPSAKGKRCAERALELVREGELEIGEPAVVSESEDEPSGCYVMAWLWVEDPKPEGGEA